MPYVLLICGKITINKYTVQYAKTRIFISIFRSFFCKNLRVFLRVFRKITAVATALTTPNAPLIGLFGANIGHGKKTKVFVVNREHLCPSLLTMKQKFTSLSI